MSLSKFGEGEGEPKFRYVTEVTDIINRKNTNHAPNFADFVWPLPSKIVLQHLCSPFLIYSHMRYEQFSIISFVEYLAKSKNNPKSLDLVVYLFSSHESSPIRKKKNVKFKSFSLKLISFS